MAHNRRVYTCEITTNASGGGEYVLPDDGQYNGIDGTVIGVRYVKDGTAPYTDGVDVDIVTLGTGQTILDHEALNASAVLYPRVACHDTTGATINDGAQDPVNTHYEAVRCFGERVKITVANGGDTKIGYFELWIED